jgi:hypothetical protein
MFYLVNVLRATTRAAGQRKLSQETNSKRASGGFAVASVPAPAS